MVPVVDLFWICAGVYVSGPNTALALASPRSKDTLFERCTSGPCGGHKEGPQGRNGSVNPLAVRQHGTITKPLQAHAIWLFYLCFLHFGERTYPETSGSPVMVSLCKGLEYCVGLDAIICCSIQGAGIPPSLLILCLLHLTVQKQDQLNG